MVRISVIYQQRRRGCAARKPRIARSGLSREIIVQRLDALNPRNRHEEVPPDEADQPLDLALVVALARPNLSSNR